MDSLRAPKEHIWNTSYFLQVKAHPARKVHKVPQVLEDHKVHKDPKVMYELWIN